MARSLGRELAAAGLVVVSGLARGIDGEAHRGALDAGGTTVAVLGCGIDRDYPAAHRDLAGRIVERRADRLRVRAGVEPAPWRFPARNRIIAGLCAATVVVEARERSGALITADFALEDGREVMVVPGEITSAVSAGLERAAPARRDAGHRAPRTCSRRTGSSPRPSRRAARRVSQGTCSHGWQSSRREHRRAGASARASPPGEVAAALIELELAGRVSEGDGVYRVTVAG